MSVQLTISKEIADKLRQFDWEPVKVRLYDEDGNSIVVTVEEIHPNIKDAGKVLYKNNFSMTFKSEE